MRPLDKSSLLIKLLGLKGFLPDQLPENCILAQILYDYTYQDTIVTEKELHCFE